MLCCCNCIADTAWSISDYADIANIVIALMSVLLAFYIFIYQRRKDNQDAIDAAQKAQERKIDALNLQEQNIRLQWFKELIVQPHLKQINEFYIHLHSIESRFTTHPISDDVKIEAIDFIKQQQSQLRKSFVDVLLGVDSTLYGAIMGNLDDLIDGVTNKIFDDDIVLNRKTVFEREIAALITYSRNDLISKIYNYKGTKSK